MVYHLFHWLRALWFYICGLFVMTIPCLFKRGSCCSPAGRNDIHGMARHLCDRKGAGEKRSTTVIEWAGMSSLAKVELVKGALMG